MKMVEYRGVAFVRCFWLSILAASLVFLCVGLLHAGSPGQVADQDQPPSTDKQDHSSDQHGMTKLNIVVTNSNDKPVANASVYVRFYEPGGFLHHDKLAELSFKTNQDGSVKVPEIPQGKILVQVIATGWHTYGKWYDVNTEEESIPIKLEPPPHWY